MTRSTDLTIYVDLPGWHAVHAVAERIETLGKGAASEARAALRAELVDRLIEASGGMDTREEIEAALAGDGVTVTFEAGFSIGAPFEIRFE